nr:hypothetical protein [Tanacetum cinerariifolium]
MAVTAGQDLATLAADAVFGYPVSAGLGCFMDATTVPLLDQHNADLEAPATALHRPGKHRSRVSIGLRRWLLRHLRGAECGRPAGEVRHRIHRRRGQLSGQRCQGVKANALATRVCPALATTERSDVPAGHRQPVSNAARQLKRAQVSY